MVYFALMMHDHIIDGFHELFERIRERRAAKRFHLARGYKIGTHANLVKV